MAVSKKAGQKVRQQTNTGVKAVTGILDGTTTIEIVELGAPMSRITFQGTGNLAGTVEFSVDGEHWFSSTAIAGANAPTTYSTHNFNSIKVTRSGGSGRLAFAATT